MSDTSTSRRVLLGAVLALAPARAFAQFPLPGAAGDLLKRMPAKGGAAALSQGDIGLGLKDALKVASRRVIGQVGRTDGYFGDPAIRIPLPGQLQQVVGPLRAMGASGLLDDLTLRMNRGAEQAAPKAVDIFVDAASRMSFEDARGILTGPQDSATQYFRRTTSGPLTTAFRPIVNSALSGAGALQALQMVQSRITSNPLVAQLVGGFDLVDFTVGRALDGIFHYIGSEEASIRTNPAARSTVLLRKVFG